MTRSRTRPPLFCVLGVSFSLLVTGCDAELSIRAVGQLDYKGKLERIETLGRYSSAETSLLLHAAGAREPVSTDHDFFLYRVIYETAAVHGGVTRVSGLVAVPTSADIRGIVSWQHGTNSYRPNSISKPTLPEGLGVSALFASAGFITVCADYIGLGVSTERHPYYHWPSTVSTVVDLLSIAEIMLEGLASAPDHDLYLAGFSQGGGATAAIQRSLQADNPTGLSLRAAAAISGAFNLHEVSLPKLIEGKDLFYPAMALQAFAYVHEQSLEGIVRERFVDGLADWFDGTHQRAFIEQKLPKRASEFFTERFLSDYELGEENPRWFYDALRATATDDYAPEVPLRIYVGSEDTVAVPAEGRQAFERMRERGGEAELVEAGPYTHDEMVVHSLPSIQQWFERLDGSSR